MGLGEMMREMRGEKFGLKEATKGMPSLGDSFRELKGNGFNFKPEKNKEVKEE